MDSEWVVKVRLQKREGMWHTVFKGNEQEAWAHYNFWKWGVPNNGAVAMMEVQYV